MGEETTLHVVRRDSSSLVYKINNKECDMYESNDEYVYTMSDDRGIVRIIKELTNG